MRTVTILVKDEDHKLTPGDLMIALLEATTVVLHGKWGEHARGWHVTVEIEDKDGAS